MADLTELQSTQAVKVVGSNSSGAETNPVNANGSGHLQTADVLTVGGVYGTITVGVTAVEVKVGGSKRTDRKLVTIDNTSNATLYWGYDSSITTSLFAGRIFKDQQMSIGVDHNVSIYLIAGSGGNSVHISEGS